MNERMVKISQVGGYKDPSRTHYYYYIKVFMNGGYLTDYSRHSLKDARSLAKTYRKYGILPRC